MTYTCPDPWYEPDALLEMAYEDRISGTWDYDTAEIDFDVDAPYDMGDRDDMGDPDDWEESALDDLHFHLSRGYSFPEALKKVVNDYCTCGANADDLIGYFDDCNWEFEQILPRQGTAELPDDLSWRQPVQILFKGHFHARFWNSERGGRQRGWIGYGPGSILNARFWALIPADNAGNPAKLLFQAQLPGYGEAQILAFGSNAAIAILGGHSWS